MTKSLITTAGRATLVGSALAALTLAAGAPASAAQERDRGRAFEALLRRADLDLDGKISRDEFPRTARAFRRLDRDRDGYLTREDFAPSKDGPEAPPEGDPAPEGPATAEQIEFFESKIRPVLAESCFSCHSDLAGRVRGDLRVDSRAALLAGGATGAAIVPGDPDASPLIEAVRYEDPIFAMPPKAPLSDEAVRDLERWVKMGAPWPDAGPRVPDDAMHAGVEVEDLAGGESLDREIDIEAGREFWSFRLPVRVEPPTPEDAEWAWGPIDGFLRTAMEEAEVEPVRDADKRTWLRRVTFDLTGLPPTPEEIEAFEADRSATAYETVVDRLLASDAFGERFGRHWLDVARYGESSGKETNVAYPHAWRYRDFVIDAMNEDMRFDVFLQKQVAGDLLEYAGEDERAENLVATGYLAIGSKSHNTNDRRQFALDVVDEQIDAVSQGMLGLTLACARCHDHKFDPVPIEDYYALAGIFLSTDTRYGTLRGAGNDHPSDLIDLPAGADVPDGPTMDPLIRRLFERGRERAERRASPDGMSMDREMDTADERLARLQQRRSAQQAAILDDLLVRFDERGRPTAANRVAMGAVEGTPRDIAVLERGELDRPGDVVERGLPQVLWSGEQPAIDEGSGRLELARWVGSGDNPLTARVWVNRIWLHMFGAGIVSTPDNFGAGGQPPSHPELLDWLATELVANDWSTKSIVREIALSHAYRLDSSSSRANEALDPDAVTRWRMADRRLEAESIRDALLAVSGTLESDPPVGSPTGAIEGALRVEQLTTFLTQERPVRSVYLPSLRGEVVHSLEVFDAPDAAFVTGDREETSAATQALFLMNDEDVLRLADAFADRLMAAEEKDTRRIRLAFEIALGRRPTSVETDAVRRFLREYERMSPKENDASDRSSTRRGRAQRGGAGRGGSQRGRARGRGSDAALAPPRSPEHAAWSAFAQALFQSAEFRTIG
ncbi:MAG: DUF1553 domain-containing protein [Planctomycetota bacterium]